MRPNILKPLAPVTLALSSLPLLLGAQAGCGGETPKPAAPVASAAPSSAPAPTASASSAPTACLPSTSAAQPIAHVERKQDSMILCLGSASETTAHCMTVDPRTTTVGPAPDYVRPSGAPTSAPRPSPAMRKVAYEVTSTATELKVCKAGTTECHVVKPGYSAAPGVGFGEDYNTKAADKSKTLTRQFHAAATEDGKRLFVLATEAKKGTPSAFMVYGDTFDVDTGKRLFHVPLLGGDESADAVADPGRKWEVTWVGSRVWLASFAPNGGGPSSQQLLNPETGDLLDLGNPAFFVKDGDVWATGIVDSGGEQVKLVEPKSLSNVGKFPIPGVPIAGVPGPDQLQAERRNDGTVWVAFSNPPGAVVIDPKQIAEGQPAMLPICR